MDNRDTFRFEYYGKDGSVTTTEFDSDNLTDVIKNVQKFLQGCGYHFVGQLTDFRNPNLPTPITSSPFEVNSDGYRLGRAPLHEPKWDFSNIPNNNWPFGTLKSEPIPSLTTVDLSSFQASYEEVNKYPTMAPLTTEQIASWKMEAPGTLGGAKVTFDKDAY